MKNLKLAYSYIVSLIFLMASAGCQNFLEEKPRSFFEPGATMDTPEGAEAFVNGIYHSLTVSKNAFYREFPTTMGMLGTDIHRAKQNATYLSLDSYTATSDHPILLMQWTGLYETIKAANVVLEKIDESRIEVDQRENFRAQALVLRGYCYFMLVRFWGDVPLVIEPVEQLDMQKSSVSAIYEQIVDDLNSAIESGGLPYKYLGADIGRLTLGAAKMMLAKVYMTMAGWPLNLDKNTYYPKAKELLMDLKNNTAYGYGLNEKYGDSFNLYKKHTKEYIWDAEFSDLDISNRLTALWAQTMGVNAGGPIHRGNNSMAGIGWTRADTTLYRLYSGEEDLRFVWNIADFRMWGPLASPTTKPLAWPANPKSPDWEFLGSMKYRFTVDPWDFKSNYPLTMWQSTPMNFPIYRFADVLLMLAEIDNELNDGPAQLALDCINAIRDRARGTEDDSATPKFTRIHAGDYDKEGFFNLVIDERARELCFEGHRWFDLTRTGLLISKLAEHRKINLAEDQIYYSIPQADVNINPNLGN